LRSYLLFHIPFFGSHLLKEITPQVLQRFIQKRKKDGIQNATINRDLAVIKHCFSVAIKWGWCRENPVKRIEMLKEPQGRVRYLSNDERKRLMPALPWWLKPIVIFAMHTGMRKSEILSLTWSQVFPTKSYVVLEDTKNNERRSVPLNQTAISVLKEVGNIRRLDVPHVFYNPVTGKRWADIQHTFQRACRAAQVQNFRFHDLRHTAASYLVMAGVGLATVKEILGHKTIEMTLRYSHLSPEHTIKAAKKLDTAFAPKPEQTAVSQTQNSKQMDTFWTLSGEEKNVRNVKKEITSQDNLSYLAGATGIEPATPGFGDRCSAN